MAVAESSAQMDGPAGRYRWRRIGEGPPLVLINGYAATASDWDPTFLKSLGTGHAVICPDNRGIGGSDLGVSPLTLEAMAADVLALLDHLEIDGAPVAGWSMGGYVAQELVRAAPERIDALVLLATDPGGSAAVRCPADLWTRLTDRGGTPRQQARRLIELLFPPLVAESIDRDFGEVVAEARTELSPEALDQQERAMTAWYEPGRERLVLPPKMPVLAAAGTLDQVIPPVNASTLAGEEGWLARFPGGGHGFMAQEPRRLGSLIRSFLAR